MAQRGMGAPEAGRVYARARELCEQIGDAPQHFPVLFGQWWYFLVRSEWPEALGLVQQLLALAEATKDDGQRLQAQSAAARTFYFRGEIGRAQPHFDAALALHDPARHRALTSIYGQEPGVLVMGFAAHNVWFSGYPDRARELMRRSLSLARDFGHPFSLAMALDHSAWLAYFCGNTRGTLDLSEEDIRFATEQGLKFFWSQGTAIHGWALVALGRHAEGIEDIRIGLAARDAMGSPLIRWFWVSLLVEAHVRAGELDEAQRILDEMFAASRSVDFWEPERFRLKGELLLARGAEAAESAFRQAIAVAQGMAAKSLELRAATSLARLLRSQGKLMEAHATLAPVFNGFTEGFDTLDLVNAKALLAELQ
jgi:predicted ATPase